MEALQNELILANQQRDAAQALATQAAADQDVAQAQAAQAVIDLASRSCTCSTRPRPAGARPFAGARKFECLIEL